MQTERWIYGQLNKIVDNATAKASVAQATPTWVGALLGFKGVSGAFVTVTVAASTCNELAFTDALANAGTPEESAASWIDVVSSPLSTFAFKLEVTS